MSYEGELSIRQFELIGQIRWSFKYTLYTSYVSLKMYCSSLSLIEVDKMV